MFIKDFSHFPLNDYLDYNTTSVEQKRTLQANSTITSSLHLTNIPLGIGILYALLTIFTFFSAILMFSFSGMSPERFSKLGCCLGLAGILLRNFGTLTRGIHYIIMLLIFIQTILIYATHDCDNADHISETGVKKGEMANQSVIINFITMGFWGCLHILCPIVKKNLHQESYIYEPFDHDHSFLRYILCDLLGPI